MYHLNKNDHSYRNDIYNYLSDKLNNKFRYRQIIKYSESISLLFAALGFIYIFISNIKNCLSTPQLNSIIFGISGLLLFFTYKILNYFEEQIETKQTTTIEIDELSDYINTFALLEKSISDLINIKKYDVNKYSFKSHLALLFSNKLINKREFELLIRALVYRNKILYEDIFISSNILHELEGIINKTINTIKKELLDTNQSTSTNSN